MKIRVAVDALITVAGLSACGEHEETSGGIVEPAATSNSTATKLDRDRDGIACE